MMLAEVVHRDPKQLAEECAKGRRATIGVRFFGSEGTQYALSTILARQASDEAAAFPDNTAAQQETKLKVRKRDENAAGQGQGQAARAVDAGMGKENAGPDQQHRQADPVAYEASPQAAAAAAAMERRVISEQPTAPHNTALHNTDAGSNTATPAAATCSSHMVPTGNRSSTSRASVDAEADLPFHVDAVQVAHDFGVCKPVLQALQEDRLLTPPFGDIIFAANQPQAGLIDPPVWQNDDRMAAWLAPRLQTMDPAQKEAFDHALSRKVALIQGPPGPLPG